MGIESDSIPTPSEIMLGQIASELGIPGASGADVLKAVRQLRKLATADSADGSVLYWSVQHGNGGTTESDDELAAMRKFQQWKEAHPDDRIELVKIVGISVDGQNLDLEYDSFGRRLTQRSASQRETKP
jgi:YD repeat-containing protein